MNMGSLFMVAGGDGKGHIYFLIQFVQDRNQPINGEPLQI